MLQTSELDPAASRSADLASLPSYLRRHVQLGFDQDDITALLDSIDASQAQEPTSSSCSSTTPVHLPAELLLQILEFVPVDYLLDWRLVCRGFRDAIDGQVLYHCLRRTRLIGFLGNYGGPGVRSIVEDEFERLDMFEARFLHVDKMAGREDEGEKAAKEPIWSASHAVFAIDVEWYHEWQRVFDIEKERRENLNDDGALNWRKRVEPLEQLLPKPFGKLSWCIALDHAVLDLDFPAERKRMHFDIDIDFTLGTIRVAWKDMLVRFLKTERALRLLLDEKRNHPMFTFSHTEDCLRAIRRARLSASLNLSTRYDRQTQWSLRLLPPLYGLSNSIPHDATFLSETEDVAIHQLLFLRRTASLSSKQLAHLHALASEYRQIEDHLRRLDDAYTEFKSHLSVPGFQMDILVPAMISNFEPVPSNPIKWSDELRLMIEDLVVKWRAQKSSLEQMQRLLEASNEAMSVPDDVFSSYDDDDDDDDEINAL